MLFVHGKGISMRFIHIFFITLISIFSYKSFADGALSIHLKMEILVKSIEWIAQNTPYQDALAQVAPTLEIVTPEVLSEILSEVSGIASFGESNVAAIYLPRKKLIVVDISNTDIRKFTGHLIHELIHHYQVLNKKNERVDCIQSLEEEAYKYQLKYLESVGVEHEYLLKIRLSSLVYGKCRPKF